MRFLDWVGRVIMLSLAGMITLSIIGAIASIPSGTTGTEFAARQAVPIPSEGAPPAEEAAPEPRQAGEPSGPPQAGSGTAVTAAPPREPEERWLEAIFYALLALAGTAALGTVMLGRALVQWRRMADAAEDLARRG